jgi:hypothetical protein
MAIDTRMRWALLICFNLLCWYVLGFHQPSSVAQEQSNGALPFANSVQQRFEIIDQLKEINAQLKEQTALFRSGAVKVKISLDQNSGR